jgi:hypothetical protein
MKVYSSTLCRMTAALQAEHSPRRAHSPLRLGIPARLLCLDGQRWVTLIDLSQGSARIALGAPGKVSGGLLRWLGFEAFGDPVWQVGDELALHFDAPIDPAWLVETRQRARVELDRDLHTGQAPGRPRVGSRTMESGTER